jgi:hypothetical protein
VNCSHAGWSAVTSALPNATLAGVLAGFMLNGIIVLLSRKITEVAKVRALGLLLAAFVALALDSYLFGVVTGDSSCHRAWTEAMLAAGLLGMGAVAVIAGFGLLVAEYIDNDNAASVALMKPLFSSLRIGVALVVLTLLFMTSWNYLHAVFGRKISFYFEVFLWVYFSIGLVALVVIAISAPNDAQRATLARKLSGFPLTNWWATLQKASRQVAARLPASLARRPVTWISTISIRLSTWLSTWLSGPGRDRKQRVNRAIYSSLIYSIGSVLWASLFARTSPEPWDHADFWVMAAFVWTVIWVLLASLVPLFYLLVRCFPPFGSGNDNSVQPAAGCER